MSAFIERQKLEIKRARELHGNVNSAHEGYAVILEELDEFWEEVRKKIPDKDKMIAELVQIAAMCQKTAEDVCKFKFCLKCNEILRGHEDENESYCRWCVTGWEATLEGEVETALPF